MPIYASIGSKGGVASQNNVATIEGLKILENGGNAFDAAITVSSLLTVMLPNTGSVGGDGFLLALDCGSELVAYNGSGRSPRDFPVEKYQMEKPKSGPLSLTVPGLVDLWEWVSDNYGSMGLARTLGCAGSVAKNGFHVQEPLAMAVESSRSAMIGYDGWNKAFGWMKSGSVASFRKLSEVYSAIARRGADAFYRSELTDDIVKELNEQEVPIASEDFAAHKGESVKPLGCRYRDYELYDLPPNSQGLSTLQLLKAIELTGLSKLPFASTERVNKFLHLAACVYEDRDMYVADPDFFRSPIDELLSHKHLRRYLDTQLETQGLLRDKDTTFFVTADKEGNLVGFIQSIFQNFGSGIVAHGIPFQSRGAGFAKTLGVPNSPAAGKRPLHTLSILLTRHETQGEQLIGCSGGDLRPQIHAEVFVNTADYNMPLAAAVETPRHILTSWFKNQMNAAIEEGMLTKGLPNWVSKTRTTSAGAGIVQAVRRRRDGNTEFVADQRGGGLAAALF
jgi:gamma-glutamyltranspeptidase/glutathione hydrolase